jgi:hypothetical protein
MHNLLNILVQIANEMGLETKLTAKTGAGLGLPSTSPDFLLLCEDAGDVFLLSTHNILHKTVFFTDCDVRTSNPTHGSRLRFRYD